MVNNLDYLQIKLTVAFREIGTGTPQFDSCIFAHCLCPKVLRTSSSGRAEVALDPMSGSPCNVCDQRVSGWGGGPHPAVLCCCRNPCPNPRIQ